MNYSIPRGWLAAACLMMVCSRGLALPEGVSAVRSLAGITECRLSNGMQVLLLPQAAHPVTRLQLTYRVGSRHEGPGEAGMAHLLEHLTFRGNRQLSDLGAEFKRLGARYNAVTDRDQTSYTTSFSPSTDTLRQVLKLEAARMQEARLDAVDLEKEKPIVFDEMGWRGGLSKELLEGMQYGAFRQHPYGRPVIGYAKDLEALALPALQAFYRLHYRPDNAVLMISGDFDIEQALQAAELSLGKLRIPEQPLPSPVAPEPEQTIPRQVTVRTTSTGLAVGYHVPPLAHPDAAALAVVHAVMQATSSWYLREENLPASQGSLSAQPNSRDPFLIGVLVDLPTVASDTEWARSKLERRERTWLGRIEGATIFNTRRSHLYDLIISIHRTLLERLQDSARALPLLAEAVGAGDWRLQFKLLQGLTRLERDEIVRVAELYLRPENRIVVRGVTDSNLAPLTSVDVPIAGITGLLSKSVAIPSVSDPTAGLDEIKALRGVQVLNAGTAFDTDPVAIEKLVRSYRLPSGILLDTLTKDSPRNAATLVLNLRWASAEAVQAEPGWRLLDRMMLVGSTERAVSDMEELFEKLQAQVSISCTAQQATITIVARKDTLLQTLALVSEMLREPRLSNLSFEVRQEAALRAIALEASSPSAAAIEQHRVYYNKHLDMKPGMPGYDESPAEQAEQLRKLKSEQVRSFHRKFWSANEARIIAVGHLPDQLIDAVEALFGNWKKPEAPPYVRSAAAYQAVPAARFNGKHESAGAAVVALQQGFALNRHDPEYQALRIGVRVLAAGGISGSRLIDRLRQQESLSYAASASLRVPNHGNSAGLMLMASGSSSSAARVEAAIHEEIARLLENGITPLELALARQELLDEDRHLLSGDRALALAMLGHMERDATFASEQGAQNAALSAVTAEQVLQALRKHLLPGRWVSVIMGGEAS